MSPRRLLGIGAIATALGLGLAATAPVLGTPGSDRTRPLEFFGGLLVIAGWAVLAWAIHAYGRAGD